jgi:Tol biopolymer transport system component
MHRSILLLTSLVVVVLLGLSGYAASPIQGNTSHNVALQSTLTHQIYLPGVTNSIPPVIPSPTPTPTTGPTPTPTTGQTTRVSVASDGTQADDGSGSANISADGRYVAFGSSADNLVSGDTNEAYDIFVHDRQTRQTTRVSVASDGTQANNYSTSPNISADGRYVAFQSHANNLVSGDTNSATDVFVHDQQTRQTTRVSVASDGSQADYSSTDPSISADGRFVAFQSEANNLVSSDTNGRADVFVHDRQTGQTTRVSVASDGSQANSWSENPSISADGRFVAFVSWGSNLVSGDTNIWGDVFVHDRQTRQTTRVSVASDGTQADDGSGSANISADGRYVAFGSSADNLVSGDTNGESDMFVHDRQTRQTTRVSVASDGTQANGYSRSPSISADGRYVAFQSHANNLVSGDTNSATDVFVHDRQTGQTTRVSVASDSTQANANPGVILLSIGPSISSNGRYVAFGSSADNLVSGDTNRVMDVFVRDRGAP